MSNKKIGVEIKNPFAKNAVRVEVEKNCLELIEAIESGELYVFKGLNTENRLSLGIIERDIQRCGILGANLFASADKLSAQLEIEESARERKKIEALRKRIMDCCHKLQGTAEELTANGAGLISVSKLGEALVSNAEERSNVRPKVDLYAKIEGMPNFETQEEAKKWMVDQQGKLDISYGAYLEESNEVMDSVGYYERQVVGKASVGLNDKQLNGKEFKSQLVLEEKDGNFAWKIEDSDNLLVPVAVKDLYEQNHTAFGNVRGRERSIQSKYLSMAGVYEATEGQKGVEAE